MVVFRAGHNRLIGRDRELAAPESFLRAATRSGETLLLAAPSEAARSEALFREALSVARAQGAAAFELRSAASLAQLLANDGRGPEGLAILGPTLESFREGSDTVAVLPAAPLVARLRSG